MPMPKESLPEAVTPDESGNPHGIKEVYKKPEVESLAAEDIDRITMCACKAGDDNPY